MVFGGRKNNNLCDFRHYFFYGGDFLRVGWFTIFEREFTQSILE